MSQAITAAIYFLVSRELGEEPKFPGNEFIYNSLDDSSSATSLADLTVYVSTQEKAGNEDFIHTNGDVYMWRYFWPFLAAHFDIKASQALRSPSQHAPASDLTPISLHRFQQRSSPKREVISKPMTMRS